MATNKVQCFAGYSVAPFGNNARLVTTHDQGYVLVSYSTPVAVYDRETDVLCKTDSTDRKGAGSRRVVPDGDRCPAEPGGEV